MHRINTSSFVFLISCYGTHKNALFLVTMASITQIEKSCIHFTQNNKLINLTKFQAKLITQSWDKMLQSTFSVLVAGGITHGNRDKIFERSQNSYFLEYSIMLNKICSMLWLIVEFRYFSFIFWIWIENPLKLIFSPSYLLHFFRLTPPTVANLKNFSYCGWKRGTPISK